MVQTPTRGYHETITRFYIWAVGRYLAARRAGQPSAPILDLTNELLGSRYGERSYPLDYYTRERLMSWEARTEWVEPDVRALEG